MKTVSSAPKRQEATSREAMAYEDDLGSAFKKLLVERALGLARKNTPAHERVLVTKEHVREAMEALMKGAEKLHKEIRLSMKKDWKDIYGVK